MSLLFRPSEHDREALRTTVRSLHEATVPGLAAALSWRTRKVERLLVEELTRPGTSMAYDPARRVVRWAPPVSVVWSAPAPIGLPPSPTASPRPAVDLGPTLAAPPPVLRAGGLRAQCPSCHTALVASSSPSLNVCPQCGRLFSSRTAISSTPEPEPTPATAPGPEPGESPPTSYGDRRSQELLAAYVTAQPIPCPRCRTPLKHRGVSEYSCPSCGESVRFGTAGTSGPAVVRTSGPSAAARLPAR
jgi:predicted RNA-binding Zn-ribbon protein involved in translation (DUF1610 family)